MDFLKEITTLSNELQNLTVNEVLLKEFIKKSHIFISTFFDSDSKLFQELRAISTEPKEAYFPEMYPKVKQESLINCKYELSNLLNASVNEFNKSIFNKSITEILEYEESQYLEFKSTLCWDIKNAKDDKKLMGEIIMKSIAAFSNSEGGILLIGIDNDKKILGLDDDYKTFKSGLGNRDDFELHLSTLAINVFSKTFVKDNLAIEFPFVSEKEVCVIRIAKGATPYTIKILDKAGQPKEKFFIRVNNSSRDIDDLLEFARYIKLRFISWN
jgi:hypothetical protein